MADETVSVERIVDGMMVEMVLVRLVLDEGIADGSIIRVS